MKHRRILLGTLILIQACSGKQIRQPITLDPAIATGFDAAALTQTLNEANQSESNIHSIVIERRGKIIAEIYRSGSDSTMMKRYGMGNPFASDTVFDTETLHDVRSVSKSVTGLLYGIPKYQNVLPSPDTTVLSVYPELQDLQNAERNRITFGHLLSMSSGLDWKEWGKSFITSDETRLLWKDDTTRFVFDRPQATEPGAQFNYAGGSTAVLADTLVRKTGKPLTEIAREELFAPLGITHWEWATDSKGRALAYAGLRLRPRDMIKIGRLVLNKGKWNGRQLISKSWIEESTRAHIQTHVKFFSGAETELSYGYQWWAGQSPSHIRSISWSAAVGNGGQRIYVVPELDMTVVMTAGDYGSLPIQKAVGKIFDQIIAAAK